MADPQSDPSLAPLGPLSAEVSPPPLAAGYSNPLLGIASEFFKLHAADNRRQANRELDRREELAQRFDQFSNDPRYSNHPDIQREAHMHAAAIRAIPYNKNRPTQYKENSDGQIPAYGALFHRAAQAEIRKNGEPGKPAEPAQPPSVANPFGGEPPAPEMSALGSGPFGPTDQAPGVLAAGPPAPVGAVPGGVQPMPGKISPAPAIGSAPHAPPDINAAPPPPAMPDSVTQSATDEVYPMTPPEMAAFNNSIPASAAPDLAEQMGIDLEANPHALIDLRALKGAGMLSKSKDREVRMRIAGLDPDTGGQLPPEQQTPIAHYRNAQADLAEARVGLVHAQTISEPVKRDAAIAAARERIAIAQRNSDTAVKRLGVSADRLAMDKSMLGMGTTSSSPTPGGSGGPSDYQSDNHVSQTNSGRYYVDLTGYTGKIKNAMMERYTSQGLPVIDGPRAKAISDIDGARLNQDSVLVNVLDRLPKDAAGRITGGLGNKLSQLLQTDEELAAFNSWRTTAIRTLRATAGSEGLRLNEKEILLAVANDVPKITDTVATAQQKQANIRAQLDNVETSILVKRRGGMKGSQGRDDYSGAAITQQPPDPNGQTNIPRAGGNVLPPASQRVVGQTTANINGQNMVWSKTSKGVGWAPAPQQ